MTIMLQVKNTIVILLIQIGAIANMIQYIFQYFDKLTISLIASFLLLTFSEQVTLKAGFIPYSLFITPHLLHLSYKMVCVRRIFTIASMIIVGEILNAINGTALLGLITWRQIVLIFYIGHQIRMLIANSSLFYPVPAALRDAVVKLLDDNTRESEDPKNNRTLF